MPDTTRPLHDFSDMDELPGPEHVLQPGETRADYLAAGADFAERTLRASNKQRVAHACNRCGGSGVWHGGYGRFAGQCFQCGGTGKILRAANYEKNKIARDARKQRQLEEQNAAALAAQQARIDAFKVAQPEIAGWLAANTNDFAMSLRQTVADYGNLSVAQEAAVRRNLTPATPAAATDDGLDVSSLKGYYAVPDGETRLKIRVKHPGKDSRFHGWVFVDDGAAYGSQQKYGSQRPGGKYSGKIQQQLRAILADPLAAQIAYGHLTGSCGVCGRMLEDAESVAAGIGPICAGKVAAGLA